jgi:hypothetical protein
LNGKISREKAQKTQKESGLLYRQFRTWTQMEGREFEQEISEGTERIYFLTQRRKDAKAQERQN